MERNMNVIPKTERAITLHGITCCICGFNFEGHYREHGKEFIEIHHRKPLSSFSEEKDNILLILF